jgi:hypothetical protein
VVADFIRTQNKTISSKKTKLKNWFACNYSNNLTSESPNQFSRDVLNKMGNYPCNSGQGDKNLQNALADMQSEAGFVLLAIDEAHARSRFCTVGY